MPRAAVICEFNPFHNGHKFLLKKIKSEYADEIVCVMSGSFVQRGEIAITDKFTRARAALEHGADMVAELPTVYAMASAQVFATAGVRLADELGCEKLCFGAENSLEELYAVLTLLDSPAVQAQIAQRMQDGDYYPRAVSLAVGGSCADVVSRPNNILALEYIRACRAYGITPVAIPRVGAEHDSDTVVDNIASATKLRDMILSGERYEDYTTMRIGDPVRPERLEAAILYRLKTASLDELRALPDVSEGLENRIKNVSAQYNSSEEILSALKTKRYTMARLRRILLCALLGITKDLPQRPVPYARVLGVRQQMSRMLKARALPLIVDVRRGYDQLDNSAKEIFDVDLRATEAMNAAGIAQPLNDYQHGIIKI